MRKQGLPINHEKRYIHYTWLCLLPMLLIACSGSLGKIQLENVDAVIAQSETALEDARLANAQDLASDTLQQAENALASAKEAVGAKDGLGAMHLAYNALTQARIAEQEAMYKSQGNGFNALIKRKEADIVALRADLKTADGALEKSRTDIRQLDIQKDRLQADMGQKLQEAEQAHREILQNYNRAKTECGDLQSKLDTTETQLLQAQRQVEEHERQLHQLRRELEHAQSLAAEARREATDARAMAAEAQTKAAEARTKAAAQARSYSRHIEQLNQSNVIKRRKDTLAQRRRAAKAYVQRQGSQQPIRTGSTSLTSQQIASGRAVINDWALAWTAKDIPQHLNEYTQDATLDQTVIRASNEEQTYLNRMQLVNALKKMVNARWQATDSKVDADGESVVGTYRFSRVSQGATSEAVPARHDVWAREVWVRQVGTEWKIFRESWRIYKAVPRYSTAFN